MMMGGRLRSFLNRVETWFSQAKTTSAEDQLQKPPEWVTLLVNQELHRLDPPAVYIEAVRAQVETAISYWQTQLEAENCLVFLSSPVEPIDQVLHHSLSDWQPETETSIEFNWSRHHITRCHDPLDIPSQLHDWLEAGNAPSDTGENLLAGSNPSSLDSLEQRQTVVVIPALERYFLRCIQGWEGVEYLQHLVTQDRSRFWIIGCNAWAWAFLDRVCRVNAYLERVELLPRLDGPALKSWLCPLAAPLLQAETTEAAKSAGENRENPDMAEAEHTSESTPEAAPDLGSDSYWNALASLSAGISTTAAYLWSRSLRLRAETISETFQDLDLTSVESIHDLCSKVAVEFDLVKPTLPGLANLEVLDRYLLHSLLLHGRMSREHLPDSLGETERLVRTRIQVLKREGVIVPQQRELAVNAVHYPKLRSELSNNNFLIGEV